MGPRKRDRDEMEASEAPQETSLLQKLRNMWEFACVMQYIFTFGKVVKIDEDFDIEDLERECLRPDPSDKLEEIGMSLLKWISSHRGITLENWDEYTRRQYIAKAPYVNPYGTEEHPRTFRSFDIFQKIRVLHQLTVWTFWNPDRIRERMPEQKEADQTLWRVEELGWDREERSYYVLDDSRLYRRTEPSPPVASKAKPKSNTLKAQAARRRASKRRRLEVTDTPDTKEGQDGRLSVDPKHAEGLVDGDHVLDTFGGFTWECVAVTSKQYQDFVNLIEKSRDPNERDLHLRIVEQVLPVVEKVEESQRRKIEKKQKELINVQRLSGAKRSSRLAHKHERERQEREAIEAAERHAAELAAAHKEQQRQAKMEQDRQSRMMTREQRTKDREYKRLLHEEELAKVAEGAERVEAGQARCSERHLKAQIEKHKRDLEGLSVAEDWVFDCSGCGVHGKNVDDGAHSVACEKCNVWQHSQCLGIRQIEAEQDDFHFICKDCKQKLEDAKRPNIKLKFRAGLSSSPPQAREKHVSGTPSPRMLFGAVEVGAQQPHSGRLPGQGQHSGAPVDSLCKVANRVVPTPYMQRVASSTSECHSAIQTSQSPSSRPASSSAQTNGCQHPHPIYPFSSNSPHHQSTASSAYTNGHALDASQTQSQLDQASRPASDCSKKQYSGYEVHQTQVISKNQSKPMNPAPRTHSVAHQASNGGVPTSHVQQGLFPSPVLKRPSMSPAQGNRDTGPVAGVPQRSLSGTTTSPPSQPILELDQNKPINLQYKNLCQGRRHINGESNGTDQGSNVDHNQNHDQHQHFPGLSPTKHSPCLPSPTPSTVLATSSPSPHLPPEVHGRSVSGTSIFPPTERLQPSPKQLSKSPVPTPSKALTPGYPGEEELKRISEEAQDKAEGERAGVITG